MRAHIRPTKAQLSQAEEVCDLAIAKATARYGWLVAIQLTEFYGFGEKRILKLIEGVNRDAEEFARLRKDGIEEEALLRRVQQIIPSVQRLYPIECE